MRLYRDLAAIPNEDRGAVLAIGNFDGVHLGHREVILAAVDRARLVGRPAAAMAFEPHPKSFFQPTLGPFRLTPMAARARLLAEIGIDIHFVPTFDAAFARQPAAEFISDVLVRRLGVSEVVVGYDFHFGYRRLGTTETLIAAGEDYGFRVDVVAQACDEGGDVYASTATRRHLVDGEPEAAAEILGRPWEIEGTVIRGDQRGRTIGYPTANIVLGDHLEPAYGVYAVRVIIVDDEATGNGPTYDGVANLGIRPMFALDAPLLESVLFDFDGDLYGRTLRVQLISRLRGEARFDSLEELIAQMDRDAAAARAILGDATPAASVHVDRAGQV